MVTVARKVPALTLLLVMAMAGCGREAESAAGTDGTGSAVEASPTPAEEVAARHDVPAPPERGGEPGRAGEADDVAVPEAGAEEAGADAEAGADVEAGAEEAGPDAEAGAGEPARRTVERAPPAEPAPREGRGGGALRDPPREGTVRRTGTEPLSPEPTPRPELRAPRIRAGTRISTSLVTALDTRTARPGDPFMARVTEEVLAADGLVLIPEGARVFGRVGESRPSEGPDDVAVLRLRAETLETGGVRRPLRATLVDAEIEAGARDSDAETAGKVAAGAAVGALLGQIVGRDTKSTVGGAVAGAAAGGAVAMVSREGQAVMRAGARLVFRVDETIVVRR